jgi:hypothetical protein
MRDMLEIGRFLFVYGIFYHEGGGFNFEAQYLVFPGKKAGEFLFEKQDWWVKQIQALGEFYLKAQFGGEEIDYDNYRTTITLTGEKPTDHYRQETDTISRLVYGFASARRRTPSPGSSTASPRRTCSPVTRDFSRRPRRGRST